MGGDTHELDDLEGCEVLFPPEVLLVLGAKRCEEVVHVHPNVDECVEEGEECRVAAGGELEWKCWGN